MRKPIQSIVNDFRSRLTASGLTAQEAEIIAKCRCAEPSDTAKKITAKKADDGTAEVLIYDYIGFDFWTGGGFTPQVLTDQLEAMKPFDKLTVRINSPGGNVFDGMAIFNILRRQEAKVSVEVEGIAASAASYIAQVADEGQLYISEAAQMMIHNAAGFFAAEGNADALDAAEADFTGLRGLLRKIDGQIAAIYSARSGRKVNTWLDLMKAETYFTGQEAVDAKLADKTITTKRPKNEDKPNVVGRQPDLVVGITAVDVRLRLMELEGA
jgi:ATP-dependent Clp protease protease subunit